MKYLHNLPLSVRIAYAIWGEKPQMVFTPESLFEVLKEYRGVDSILEKNDNIFTRFARRILAKEMHAVAELRLLSKMMVFGEIYGTTSIFASEGKESSLGYTVPNEANNGESVRVSERTTGADLREIIERSQVLGGTNCEAQSSQDESIRSEREETERI